MPRVVRCAAAACMMLTGACYRYTPTSDAPRDGADLRIHLTAPGAESLAPILGAGTTHVTGRVASATDQDIVLIVSETGRGESRVAWSGERITLPRAAVASAERRSLDGRRTIGVAAIGVGTVGLVAIIVNAISSRSGGQDDGGVITPPEA